MADNIQIYTALNDPYQKPTQLTLKGQSQIHVPQIWRHCRSQYFTYNTMYLSIMYDSYYQQPLYGANKQFP
jgi:hypothetical protein